MDMHDLVIRAGTIVDGRGAEPVTGDVAIENGRITEVGRVQGASRREINADGLLVAPGFVDVHTHYDGQVTWDPMLSPSCWHGVTTVVMGNCGVGFAPVAPERRDWLIGLMEGVEDIPGTALAEGIRWEWETFPEYLDAIERLPRAIDVGAQLPHAALRTYVMSDRGGDHTQTPTPDEIERMSELAREAMEAGALGFTTSRTVNHRSVNGEPTPSLTASEDELVGIARGVGQAGKGVFEVVADFIDLKTEFALLRNMCEVSGRPMSITVLQNDRQPGQWRELLDLIGAAAADGLQVKGQVATRPVGLLMSHESKVNPFAPSPSYRALADLPLQDRVERLRNSEVRQRILAEGGELPDFIPGGFNKLFALGNPPRYEPDASESLGARAQREGRSVQEIAYDIMLEDKGRGVLYVPVMNYTDYNLDALREMLLDPNTVPGLGDAGAHCTLICDGSFPTYLITHWGRDRDRGEGIPLPLLIKSQTRDTAELVGLNDRGLIAPGMKADVNLIDFEALAVRSPEMRHDLPTGAKRLVQAADGYHTTIVSGEIVLEQGEHSGALPGQLVRGARGA
ncbi:amidohydrolase family protein [Myxococcota bacterium]|nr:amidohydrolase family protein [Myxococcota bacterium]